MRGGLEFRRVSPMEEVSGTQEGVKLHLLRARRDVSAGGKLLALSSAILERRMQTPGERIADGALRLRAAKAVLLVTLLVGSAALLAATVAASHPWLVSWFTILPLLVAIRILRPGQALASGVLWGGSLFVFLASQAEPAIHVSVLSFLLLSLVPGVFAFAGAGFTRRFGFNPFILGFGWAGVEVALTPIGLGSGLIAGGHGFASGTVGYMVMNLVGSICMASFIAVAGGLLIALGGRICEKVLDKLQRQVYGVSRRNRFVFPREIAAVSLIPATPSRPRAPPIR